VIHPKKGYHMKKLQILTLSMILSTSFMVQATLVNGFSNIQASNPRSFDARKKASDDRIAEEMGTPVTQEELKKFADLTKNYIKSLKQGQGRRPSRTQLETAVKAVIDLVRASKQLGVDNLSPDLTSQIASIKTKISQLNLPSQLKNMLQSMIQ
jgi:hypothetical protein